MLGMLGLFEYHPKKEAEIQLSQRWLQLIQTREQLIQARISCIWHATTAVLGCYYSCLVAVFPTTFLVDT